MRRGDLWHPKSMFEQRWRDAGAPDPLRCVGGYAVLQPLHREPVLGLPFDFVSVASFSPYVLRAAAFADVGGLDEGMADPGDCAIVQDFELSMRLWRSGWQARSAAARGAKAAAAARRRRGAAQVGRLRGPHDSNIFASAGEGGTHQGESFARCWVKMQQLAHAFVERQVGPGVEQARDPAVRSDPHGAERRRGAAAAAGVGNGQGVQRDAREHARGAAALGALLRGAPPLHCAPPARPRLQ